MTDEGNEALPESVDAEAARELVAGGRVRVIDVRSAEIAASLREGGTDASSIEGGFDAWAGDGNPTAPGRDEEYDGPKVTLPGAVSSSGEDDDGDGEDEDES